jgi:hypothetical protein
MTSRSRAAIAACILTACGASAPPAPKAPPPPSGVSGVVLGPDGAPAAHAHVDCWVPRADATHATTIADEHGRFSLDLAPGHYVVRATTDAADTTPVAVTIDPGRRTDGVTVKMYSTEFEIGIGNFF